MSHYILTKKATHLYGHIFEHTISRRLENFVLNSNMLKPIEVNFWAYTSDDNIILDIENLPICKFNQLSSCPYTKNEIIEAINEISCEYKKTYEIRDLTGLVSEINKIGQKTWKNVYEMLPAKDEHGEDMLDDELIVFSSRRHPSKFRTVAITYQLPEKFDKLRPLAVYIFFTIAQVQISMFLQKFVCYDIGGEWSSWDKTTAHVHFLVFKKGQFNSANDIKKVYSKNLTKILDNFQLVKKLISYLKDTSSKDMIFKPGEIDEYSRYIIGSEGWKQLATQENIQTVLENMKIKVKFISS